MATPKWFDANAYMQNKLAQLKAQEPDAGWTLDNLYDAFREGGFVGPEGQYEHFVKFGAAEEVAPNAYFNADEYYAAKAKQYYEEELKQEFTGSEEQIANVKNLIKTEGMNAWTHYQQFGSAEGVNPSNAFDAAAYCAAKAAAMGGDWTAEKIADAIANAGMSVLEHYLTFAGTGEGEVAAGSTYPVADEDQVVVPNPGETFVLKAGIEQLQGTSGDDVFKAEVNAMDAGDVTDGGAGNDTLEVYGNDTLEVSGNAALKGAFTNIENLSVIGASGTYDLSSFSKSFTLKAATGNVSVTNVTNQTLVMEDSSDKKLTATFDDAQTSVELVNEDSKGATFSVQGAKLESVSLTTNVDTTLGDGSGDTVKNVVISALGDSKVSLSNLVNLENVTVAGEGSVTLAGAIRADINATDSTGGVTVSGKLANTAAFTGGAGNDTITLGASTKAHDMGAGDDTVKITEALGKGVSINGGDGIDTLEMTTDIAKNFRVGDAITGFEILKLSGTGTVDMDNFGDINHVIAGTAAVTVNNIDSNGTIEFNKTANVDMTVTVKDAEKADNASDVLNVTIADDSGVTVQKLTVDDVENINITADDTDFVAGGAAATHTLTLAADKATSVTVSGDAKLTLKLEAASTAIKDINASENTGGLTVDLGSTLKGVTVTGSSADDTITMGIGNTVTGGEGKDTFIATATDATVSFSTIMNFEAGDKLQIAGMTSLAKVDIESGTTNFDAVVTKALETATNTNAAWFVYDNNTYVVLEGTNNGAFEAGDYLVQLNGVVDLSNATVASSALSLPDVEGA